MVPQTWQLTRAPCVGGRAERVPGIELPCRLQLEQSDHP